MIALLSLILAQAAAGTGEIRGRVIDKDTGRPIARAAVLVMSADNRENLSTSTDEDGVFRFSAVPPGRYAGLVREPRHEITSIPPMPPARELVVAKGEMAQVVVSMRRAYAITFRIVNAFGDPLSGLRVDVRSVPDGRPAESGSRLQSDDNGRVRVNGLPPGRYIACVDPSSPFNAPALRSPSASTGDRFLRTCYPSTGNEAEAEPITVGRSDLEGVEIRVRRGRTFTVSGSIVDASGAGPAGVIAFLHTYTMGSSSGSSFNVDTDGRFRLTNVQPGSYQIEASIGGWHGPQDRGPTQAAVVAVQVADDDVENLVVSMRRTFDVEGRFILEDPSAAFTPRPNSGPMMISSHVADLLGLAGSRSAVARSDRTFTLPAQFGTRTFEVMNVPPGWFVTSMQYGTTDALDHPVEIKGADDRLDIVLSNHGATISGTVADVIDKRLARARVFLFRLPASDKDVSRLAGSVLSATGNYTFGPIRDGDYSIVALPADTLPPQPGDRDRLAALSALGERVTVANLDQRTVELRVTTVR